MRKQFIGTIVTVGTSTIVMRVLPANEIVALDAGAAVLEQARAMGAGRTVRFSAELDERTQCLTAPRFVISSQFGLQLAEADL